MMMAVHIAIGSVLVGYCIEGVTGYNAFRQLTQADILKDYTLPPSPSPAAMISSGALSTDVSDGGSFSSSATSDDTPSSTAWHYILIASPYIKLCYAFLLCLSYPVMSYSGRASMHRLLLEAYRLYQTLRGNGSNSENSSSGDLDKKLVGHTDHSNGFDSRTVSPAQREAFGGENFDSSEFGSQYESIGSRDHPGHITSDFPVISPPTGARAQVDAASKKKTTWTDTCVRIAEALFLVTVTSLAAIFLPGITIIFGLTGSVTATAIMYIFPSMFFLRAQCMQKERDRKNATRLVPEDLHKDYSMPRSVLLTIVAWIMLIGGILCGIGSTFVVIYGAVKPPLSSHPCSANSNSTLT
jgi:hypothetical protein